ncbi:MAG TPA: hypothetical protein EYG16_02555 [Deltaproteobacteria bacterium]|nr:hypothetical protein [Candidatus Binatota bacterium]HIL12534.1 hypothetical protein [Deltaproteobacteria bacterium]
MKMSVDFRTRTDGEPAAFDPGKFFSDQLPAALEANHELVMPGASLLGLRPITIESGGDAWSLSWDSDRVVVQAGPARGAARVKFKDDQLAGLVRDQFTPITFMVSGALDMPEGNIGHLLDWWLVLRGALDSRTLHTPGAVSFVDRQGEALDLHRAFGPDDPVDEMSWFLHEAGYLHITGMFGEKEMARIASEMDLARPSYEEGDGRSWWATTGDGKRQLVRMQAFDERSEGAAELLQNDRFLSIGGITGDGHVHAGLENNRIEALVKPIGVVEGISDVPWHKDCSLGRHSYECCSLTVGISVTGADSDSGQLRVTAGSHRALLWPSLIGPGNHDLPEIDLPTRTGDITAHLSCTLHMSQPPAKRERRVMYTGFRFSEAVSPEKAAARARLREVREGAYTTVSQEPALGETAVED